MSFASVGAASESYLGDKEEINSVADTDATDDEQLRNLKEYILQIARKGPAIYSVLEEQGQNGSRSSIQTPAHRNAFTTIAVEDATTKLEQIIALPPLYSFWFQMAISGTLCGGLCGLVFGGGWYDILVSTVMGSTVPVWKRITVRPFDKLVEFVSAVAVAFFTRLLIHFGLPLCYTTTTISSLIQHLQGVTLTTAMVELATRNMVPGTTRLFSGLTMTTLMGFGMEFGLEMISYALDIPDQAGQAASDPAAVASLDMLNRCVAVDYRFKYLIFPLTAISSSLNMNAHWRQLPGMVTASFIAYIVPNYYAASLNRQIAVALAAFCAGVFANIFARYTGVPAMVPTYAAMVQLVPGSMALRSITELMGADPTNGVSLVMTVLSVSLSIGMGLFMAAMTITPIQNLADHLKGKHRVVDDLENLAF